MEQSPTPQPTPQPTSESAPQSTPEPTPESTPTPAPEPASQPGQPAIKSFADFLKSPNRIAITSLAILFAIIAGLIIAIMIVSNSNKIQDSPSTDTPSEQQLTNSEMLMASYKIKDLTERFNYFADLKSSTTDESYKNIIMIACSTSMSFALAYDKALSCLEGVQENQLNNETKVSYYTALETIYRLSGDEELSKLYQDKRYTLMNEMGIWEGGY